MTHQGDGCIEALKEKLISAEQIINGLVTRSDMAHTRLRDFEALKLLLEENPPSGSGMIGVCDWGIDQRVKIKKFLTKIGERPTCF